VRVRTLLEAARSQVEEESLEAGVGRRRQVGLRESLVVVAAAVEESPEGMEERVRLGNPEAVVGYLPCLEGNQAGVAVPGGADVMVKVLQDRLISGCIAVVRCKAYVRSLEEDPPASECHRQYLLPPLLWTRRGEGPLAWEYRRRCPLQGHNKLRWGLPE
jgi:hypothetical protein